jgi:hypothetical protein
MKTFVKYCCALAVMGTLQLISAAPISIGTATLLGSNEVPATGSPATGFASLTLDGNLLTVSVNFSGLVGGAAAAAHIHCCTAPGTNTGVSVGFPGFPASTSGTYTNTFDLTQTSVYTAAFLTSQGGTAAGAEAGLLAGIAAGRSYVNIHNAQFPGGEIRGFVVPEPGGAALVGLGFGLIAVIRKRAQVR